MELDQIKSLWNDCDEKLNKNLKLNTRILNEINLNKTRSYMNKILFRRVIETLVFFILVMALFTFMGNNFSLSAPFISACILNVFCIIGLIGSISQIVLIKGIDFSGPVTSIQKQLSQIKSHGIRILKLLFLSIPFYTAYIFLGYKLVFGIDLFQYADTKWLIFNFTLSLCLIVPTIWLYKQFSKKGPTSKWIKSMMEDAGGEKQIASALKLLWEIDNFEKEES